MPIYEYQCIKCRHDFEKLVLGSNPGVVCPKCGSQETKKRLSRFGLGKGSGDPSSSSSGSGCGGCSASSCAGCK